MRIPRTRTIGLTTLVLLWVAFTTTPVAAADLTVMSPTAYVAADGLCSLVEAIDNANNDATTHADCPAGSGADTITLAVPVTLDGTATFDLNGATGLPPITSPITIEGHGRSISRDAGTTAFRVMAVDAGGNLTLNRVTVSGGQHSTGFTSGGGIYTAGTLTITRSVIQNNTVDGIFPNGGGVYGTNTSQITITDSIIQGNVADNNNAASVFDNGGGVYAGGTLTMRNVTVQNNRAGEQGGGVYVIGTTTINNSTFAGNTAPITGGGALLAFGSIPTNAITINNSTFTNNTAGEQGGAILSGNDALTIFGSTFSGNTVQDGSGGGAIFNSGGTATITASIFDGNRVLGTGVGGAIVNVGLGNVTLIGSTVRNNTSETNGGGLFTQLAPFTVTDSLIIGNSAQSGGGLYEGSSNIDGFTIQRTVVRDNVASFLGGGAAFLSNLSTSRVYNSTFTGNRATSSGGAIGLNSGGQVEIAYSTVSENDTTQFTNGVGGTNLFAGTATLTGNIIANNDTGDCSATNGSTSNGFNVSLSPSGGIPPDRWCSFIALNPTDLPATDPLLNARGNNGGIDVSYTLGAGSPAIDINPADCPAFLNGVDQRGVPRPAGSCDAGAISSDPVILPQVYFRTATSTFNTEGSASPQTVELVVDNTAGNFNTPTTVPLTIYISQRGTATDTLDYTDTQADPVQFTLNAANYPTPGNSAVLPITFTVVDDDIDEPNETITLSASLTGAGVLDTTRNTHTLTIIDDDPVILPGNNNDDNDDEGGDDVTPTPLPLITLLGFEDTPQTVRWVATVTNPTANDMNNVVVTFTLPAGLSLTETNTAGAITVNGQTVTIILGALPANGNASITLFTSIGATLSADAVINTACLTVNDAPAGCVSAQVITTLPQTGEPPASRGFILLLGTCVAGLWGAYHLTRQL